MWQKLYKFIQYSVCSLPIFGIRTNHPNITKEPATLIDFNIATLFLNLITPPPTSNLHPQPSFTHTQQAILAKKVLQYSAAGLVVRRIFTTVGGAGLFSSSKHNAGAYLGSIALSAKVIRESTRTFLNQDPPSYMDALEASLIEQAKRDVASKFASEEELLRIFPIFQPESERSKIQHAIAKYEKLDFDRGNIIIASHLHSNEPLFATDKIKRRFLSASHQYAGKWLQADPKLQINQLDDEIARDSAARAIGLQPFTPSTCRICNTAITNPSLDHGVACGRIGGNKSAGSIIEKSVVEALKLLGEDVHLTPPIMHEPLWQRRDPDDETEHLGDILTYHNNQRTIIDTVFTSSRTASDAEHQKARSYKKKLIYPDRSFVPMGIDNQGAWGESMEKYFHEIKQIIAKSDDTHRKRTWHYAIQRISLGVCRANNEYIKRVRKGSIKWPKKERKKNETTTTTTTTTTTLTPASSSIA